MEGNVRKGKRNSCGREVPEERRDDSIVTVWPHIPGQNISEVLRKTKKFREVLIWKKVRREILKHRLETSVKSKGRLAKQQRQELRHKHSIG